MATNSEAMKIKWRTDTEFRRKGLAHLHSPKAIAGRIAALKSAEVRAKMSASTKKRLSDPAERQKLRDGMARVVNTPEYRRRRSEAAKKQFSNPEARRKLSEAAKVRMANPEYREKLNRALKAAWEKRSSSNRCFLGGPSQKVIIGRSQLEAPRPKQPQSETGKKISAALRRHFANPQNRERQSARTRAYFASHPEAGRRHSDYMKALYREDTNFRRKWSESQRKANNGSEQQMARVLDGMGFAYERQVIIGGYFADFRLLDSKVLIEVDGFWHQTPDVKARDELREKEFLGSGYSVVRVPCGYLRKDESSVVDAVAKALVFAENQEPQVVRIEGLV